MFTKLAETFHVSMVGLVSNKLRSGLTMTGITIGVAAVIILISAGQAVQMYITDQFNSLGSNLLTVFTVRDSKGRTVALTMDDAAALQNTANVPDAAYVMPQFNSSQTGVFNDTQATIPVQGVTVDYLPLRNRTLTSGRFFTATEQTTRARVAVIGTTTARNLFGDTNPVGQSIRVGAVRFEIIGLLTTIGGGVGGDNDDLLLIPITTAQSRLGGDRSVNGSPVVGSILVQARSADVVDLTQTEVESALRVARRLRADEADNFRIISQTTILDSLTSTLGLLTVFLGVIAGISLLVGGIGVMNIMLVTVTERTREIGLRKAVGAQNGDIVFQFLVESVILTLFGGSLGVLFAFGAASLARSLIATLPVAIAPASVVLAVVISAAIGIFFGIYPARRAAGLNPIDALRYE